MHEVEDEPLFAERAAGIDIAKAGIEVTIRVPSDTRASRRQQETRSFATTRRALAELADWLRSWQVTRVGMEATGDYWKPVYFVLESAGFGCQLYHAAQVKALPGRPKTDRADSVWLARITERGMLSSSFVPPAPVRALRTHTRYRRHLTQARTAEKQRVEKLLEDGHLKLSSVISDIHGASGRAMLEAIITASATPRRWPSWPAAPCAARSPSWKKPSTVPYQRQPHPLFPRCQIPPARQAHDEKESPGGDRQLRPDHLPRPAV
jgi:transposase